jgi:hypothetical protein
MVSYSFSIVVFIYYFYCKMEYIYLKMLVFFQYKAQVFQLHMKHNSRQITDNIFYDFSSKVVAQLHP